MRHAAISMSPLFARCLVILAAFGSVALADDRPPLTDEDLADLAWFQALGYPDTAGKAFVRLRVQPQFEVRGFLLEDAGERIRVVGLGLDMWDVPRSPPGTPEEKRVLLERLRADDLADAWLRGGVPPTAPRTEFPLPGAPSVSTEILVLADHLHRTSARRHDPLVHGLLEHARTLWPDRWRSRLEPGDTTRPLRDRVAEDLSEVETFRLKTALTGSSWWGEEFPRGRPAQLEAARALLRRFPGCDQEAEVSELAATLDRMVKGARDRAAHEGPAGEPTREERIADLIFRLREETPVEYGAMGAPGPISGGPYKELVSIGRAAVPALLDALDDESLTYYGGEGRSGMSPYFYRVGDVVLMAIGEIAGRRFTPKEALPRDLGRREYRAAWREAVRPQIEDWLAGTEKGRDPKALIARVEASGWDAVAAAPLLLAKDPDAYAPALRHALAGEKDRRMRYELLTLLARHPDEAGREAIRNEAASGDPCSRLDMVFHLVDLKDPAAPDALLTAWKERRDGRGPQPRMRWLYVGDREDELIRIARALLATGRPDLVRVLIEDPLTHSPAARSALVRELVAARAAAAKDVAPLIEAGLVALTADRTELVGPWGEERLSGGMVWRVCDAAASELAEKCELPEPKRSDPLWVRERAVRGIAKACGATVPAEAPWSPEDSPLSVPDDLEARFDAIAAHPYGTAERREAVAAVEPAGLAALPALEEGLAAGRFGFARDVEALAGRLAYTVRAVIVHGQVPAELEENVRSLEGEILTSPALHRAVWATISATGKSFGGASIDVYRDGSDLGVVVTLTALDGTWGGWRTNAVAVVGGKRVPQYGLFAVRRPRDESSLSELCDAALVAPPGVPVWIHAVSVFTGPN